MSNNSEEIISIVSDSLDAMYVSLGKLVAAKAKLHTLKNFIHTMEMLDQSWLQESNPFNQYAVASPQNERLQDVAQVFANSIRGREMISVPRLLHENVIVQAGLAMGKLEEIEAKIKELEERLANNTPLVNNMCV